jgi:hypothetical protein
MIPSMEISASHHGILEIEEAAPEAEDGGCLNTVI